MHELHDLTISWPAHEDTVGRILAASPNLKKLVICLQTYNEDEQNAIAAEDSRILQLYRARNGIREPQQTSSTTSATAASSTIPAPRSAGQEQVTPETPLQYPAYLQESGALTRTLQHNRQLMSKLTSVTVWSWREGLVLRHTSTIWPSARHTHLEWDGRHLAYCLLFVGKRRDGVRHYSIR